MLVIYDIQENFLDINFTLNSKEADIEDATHLSFTFPESIEYSEGLRNGSSHIQCNAVVDVNINSCGGSWCPSNFEYDYQGNTKLFLRAKDPKGMTII